MNLLWAVFLVMQILRKCKYYAMCAQDVGIKGYFDRHSYLKDWGKWSSGHAVSTWASKRMRSTSGTITSSCMGTSACTTLTSSRVSSARTTLASSRVAVHICHEAGWCSSCNSCTSWNEGTTGGNCRSGNTHRTRGGGWGEGGYFHLELGGGSVRYLIYFVLRVL